ncbi:MAG: septum formation initiator family protein [Oscillospiraceae bacterium]|nr:septum formation initiator family protein [Oscillospiraceae bacterium]
MEKKAEKESLSARLTTIELENERLQDEIANVSSPEGITEIARNKLGLVTDGEVVFYDVGK